MEKFIPRKPEKEVISMRIAVEILDLVDKTADAYEIGLNEFLNQCIVFELSNMAQAPNE